MVYVKAKLLPLMEQKEMLRGNHALYSWSFIMTVSWKHNQAKTHFIHTVPKCLTYLDIQTVR